MRNTFDRLPIHLITFSAFATGCGAFSTESVGSETEGITGGQIDVSTPQRNATVSLGGCTGTLVSANLVLSANHCQPPPLPEPGYPNGANTILYQEGGANHADGTPPYLFAYTKTSGQPNRVFVQSLASPPGWVQGPNNLLFGKTVAGMTFLNGSLYVATTDNQLRRCSVCSTPDCSSSRGSCSMVGTTPVSVQDLTTDGTSLDIIAGTSGTLMRCDPSNCGSASRWTTFATVGGASKFAWSPNAGVYFIDTTGNQLESYSPSTGAITPLGSMDPILGMTVTFGRIYALTQDNRIIFRPAVPWSASFTQSGTTNSSWGLQRLTSQDQKLYAIGKGNVFSREAETKIWRKVGQDPGNYVAATGFSSDFYGLTTDGHIGCRALFNPAGSVTTSGSTTPNAVALTSDASFLYRVDSDSSVWRRTRNGCNDATWNQLSATPPPDPIKGLAVSSSGSLIAITDGPINEPCGTNGIACQVVRRIFTRSGNTAAEGWVAVPTNGAPTVSIATQSVSTWNGQLGLVTGFDHTLWLVSATANANWSGLNPNIAVDPTAFVNLSGPEADFGPNNASPIFTDPITQYSKGPGQDIILYLLSNPVPSDVAVPVPVVTTAPTTAAVNATLLMGVGYSAEGLPASEAGLRHFVTPGRVVNTAALSDVANLGVSWMLPDGGVDSTKSIGHGDSGGPLYVADPSTQNPLKVLGALSGGGGQNPNASYSPTFDDGTSSSGNTSAWLQFHGVPSATVP